MIVQKPVQLFLFCSGLYLGYGCCSCSNSCALTCLLGRRVIFMTAKMFALKWMLCMLGKNYYGWFTQYTTIVGTTVVQYFSHVINDHNMNKRPTREVVLNVFDQ